MAIEAPRGMQFVGTQCAYHCIYYANGAWRKSEIWLAMLEEMGMGVELAVDDAEYWLADAYDWCPERRAYEMKRIQS